MDRTSNAGTGASIEKGRSLSGTCVSQLSTLPELVPCCAREARVVVLRSLASTSANLPALSTRWTDARLMPIAVARARIVQRPAGGGVASSVYTRECASAVIDALRPRPGASR